MIANASELSAERLSAVRLSLVEGLGAVKTHALFEAFGSAANIFAAGPAKLAMVHGIGKKLAAAIFATDESTARAYAEQVAAAGCRFLFDDDPEFPPQLKQIADCPQLLMCKGTVTAADHVAVGIVGSRHCTAYGRRIAQQLARDLAARGVTVASGLARGIDSVAHRAALEMGGRTVAVLASGLANIYPPEHADLAAQVAASGAVVSEAHLEGPPIGALFPQRNRIISGMSLGVVVVEAALRSGALSTARHALEQNRDVFAVPGRVGDPASEGTNKLIQQGAIAVTKVEDILEVLGPIDKAPTATMTFVAAQTPPANASPTELALWNAIGIDDSLFEDLLERTQLRASEASAALLMMEMRKLVKRLPGNRYERTR